VWMSLFDFGDMDLILFLFVWVRPTPVTPNIRRDHRIEGLIPGFHPKG
jgi:hypothetical protein